MTIDITRVAAIVLDLGGVLIEVDPDRCFRFWSGHARCSPEVLRGNFVIDEHYAQHERGEIEFAEYAAHLRRQLALDADEMLIRQGWNALLGDALPDAATAIERATERFPCFLFSNSNATHQAVWSRAHRQLLAPLTRHFVSSELGCRKPEPEAFELVAELAGFAPDALLFFDDLEENVCAARDVGFQALRVDGPRDILALMERA